MGRADVARSGRAGRKLSLVRTAFAIGISTLASVAQVELAVSDERSVAEQWLLVENWGPPPPEVQEPPIQGFPNTRDPVLEAFDNCLKTAAATSNITREGNQILYFCTNESAHLLFNVMVSKGMVAAKAEQNDGTFIIYSSNRNQCWHKIADSRGFGVDEYGCALYQNAGPIFQ